MSRTCIFLLLLILTGRNCCAQNSFGALHSNYTPTNSLYINPSSILDSKVWLDVNILGVGTFLMNDLVYIKNKRLSTEIKHGIQETSTFSDDDIAYNQSRKKYHAYNKTFVAGPSAVWSQGNHAVGLSSGIRSYTAARRIPDYIAEFIENGIPDYTVQHDIDYSLKNFSTTSISFAEVKLTYANTFLKKRKNMWMGGITFSKFFSIIGAAANVYDLNFNVDNDTVLTIQQLDADLMFSSNPGFDAKGGFGFDIGFTYQRMLSDATNYYPNSRKYGCKPIDYLYKVGLSVIDIGYVRYNNPLFAGYSFGNYEWRNYKDEEVNEDDPVSVYENQEPDINSGRNSDPTKVWLPTFVSGQFDYNIWNSMLYVNATFVQGFNPRRNTYGIRHANSLSVTPRFESYWVDVAVPFSLYEYKVPQMGLSVRLGPVTLGTDKLLNWIMKKDIYGADIYFYTKIPIKYNPKCRKGRKFGIDRRLDQSRTRCTI